MCKKLISTHENKFIDIKGRHTILHGINMVCKEKERNYIGDYKDEDFITLKRWGFNVIRLGIFWDGVEPIPGQYDDNYLAKIDQLIDLAGKHDICVVLDMHQDLFSCIYSDGAPTWATITDGKEHIETELWSESYLLSGAVQTAFDNFWNNRATTDGIGIQDHFINMWKHIATRYKDNVSVIGYDILNEPFMGSEVNHLLQTLLLTLGDMISENEPVDLEKLMVQWLDPEEKMELLSLLADKDLYLKLVRGVESISQQFDISYLSDFYNKTGRAIREVDQDTIIFLEANYFSNAGMKSGIRPIIDVDGTQIKYQAYSPHGYDLLVDTEMYDQSSKERIDVIFDTHKRVQDDLQLPMLVGEWGCYPNASKSQIQQALYLTGIFDQFLASDTYFDFSHIYNNNITKVVIRPYLVKAAGDIIRFCNNAISGSFRCSIKEKISMGDSVIYVPDISLIGEITVEPKENGYRIEQIEGSNAGYIIIPVSDQEVTKVIGFIQKSI